MSMKKKTVNAVKILHDRYYKEKPKRRAALEQERVNAKIARDIYRLRTSHKLTQKQLAGLVGTTPSVISRLENADYPGHSLNMLQRIAAAFDRRVEVKFVRSGARTGSAGESGHQGV